MTAPPLLRFASGKDAVLLSEAIENTIRSIPYYNDLAKNNETARYGTAALKEKICADSYSVIIATINAEVAGFCISRFDDYTIWLEWFGVTADYRGMGLTKLLLRELERTVAERSCHKIWCDCRTSNRAAIHLLSTTGYTQIATINNHWYNQDFILWQKAINVPG